MKEKLTEHYKQRENYPFLANLKEPLAAITETSGKPYAFYLTEFTKKDDELLDLKEEIIDPLTNFMAGPHKIIYDEVRDFLRRQESNFSYLENDAEENLQTIINNPACYKNNAMQEAKGLVLQTRQEIQALIEKEKSRALATVIDLENRLSSMAKFVIIPSGLQIEVKENFKKCRHSIEQQSLIAVINDSIHRFEKNDYQQMLTKVHAWQPPKPDDYKVDPDSVKPPVVIKEPTLVPLNTIKPAFNNALLATEDEVDLYLSSLKKAIMQEINNHKEISL